MFEQNRQGAVHVVSGDDPITSSFVEKLSETLDECTGPGLPRVVIDLTSVPLMDSHGLELILSASENCSRRGGALHVAGANSLCHDILRITGVGERVGEFDDVSQAVRSFLQ